MTRDNVVSKAAEQAPRKSAHRPMLDAPIAQYSGECAWCGSFLAAGRSKIIRLDVPLLPAAEHFYARSGGLASRKTGEPATLRSRTFVHLDCANAIDAAEADLELVAAERRGDLEALRQEARAEQRRNRRPR